MEEDPSEPEGSVAMATAPVFAKRKPRKGNLRKRKRVDPGDTPATDMPSAMEEDDGPEVKKSKVSSLEDDEEAVLEIAAKQRSADRLEENRKRLAEMRRRRVAPPVSPSSNNGTTAAAASHLGGVNVDFSPSSVSPARTYSARRRSAMCSLARSSTGRVTAAEEALSVARKAAEIACKSLGNMADAVNFMREHGTSVAAAAVGDLRACIARYCRRLREMTSVLEKNEDDIPRKEKRMQKTLADVENFVGGVWGPSFSKTSMVFSASETTRELCRPLVELDQVLSEVLRVVAAKEKKISQAYFAMRIHGQ